MRKSVRAGIVATVVVGSLAISPAAFAASNHGISGTPYSNCNGGGGWYTSDVARYKAGVGIIKVKFSDIGDNGLEFKAVDAHNSTIGHPVTFTKQETDWWQQMASGVANGKKFFNAFKEVSTGCFTGNHNFTGTEYY